MIKSYVAGFGVAVAFRLRGATGVAVRATRPVRLALSIGRLTRPRPVVVVVVVVVPNKDPPPNIDVGTVLFRVHLP